jgi:hypothetical protein
VTDHPRFIEAACEETWRDRDAIRTYCHSYFDGCPTRFLSATVETLDHPDDVLDLAAEWFHAHRYEEPPPNLIILGGVGTGKTHLACALVDGWLVLTHQCETKIQRVTPRDRGYWCERCNVEFVVPVTVPGLTCPGGCGRTFDRVGGCFWCEHSEPDNRATFTTAADLFDDLRPGGECELTRYTDAGLLVLDDVGATRSNDFTHERLLQIIDRRWTTSRPTIVTSNLTAPGLRKSLGERTYDRLRDNAVAIQLGGGSRRRERGVA